MRLVRVASAGGNYILNIGPKGDGSVVPYEAQVLQGIGAWLKQRVCREAPGRLAVLPNRAAQPAGLPDITPSL